jgi:hypothetical protein
MEISPKKYNLLKKISYVYLAALLLAPPVLLVLPADFFDKGQSLCLSVLLFKQTCWGCGMTRAVQHLIHFDIARAGSFNKLSFIVLPLLVFVWAQESLKTYRKIKAG